MLSDRARRARSVRLDVRSPPRARVRAAWVPVVRVISGACVCAALWGLAFGPVVVRAAAQDVPPPPPLFQSHEVLAVSLRADIDALRDDRSESPDRPGTLSAQVADDIRHLVEVEVRTRGEFRLDPSNCSFPPLRIDVRASSAEGTVFEGQDDLKLVSSCRPGRASYDELVLTEYLAYRTLQLVTDRSFRVRLVSLTFVDESGASPPETRDAFLIEEDEALAARFGAQVYELEEGKNLPPAVLEPTSALTTAVFQYMIGNTDWSDVAGHNVELLDRGGVALVVPYDFDISGIVDAPYATSNPDFGLSSVRERYFRGWCTNPLVTGAVLERFRSVEPDVLDLWRSFPSLSDETRARSIGYLEEFFDAIETDERAQRRFLRDCRRQTG